MSSFTKHPALRLLPDGESWEVAESFEYHVGSEDSNEIIKVPKGFITDGASIPKIFWSIIGGPWGKYGYAAVVHDYLYYKHIYTRRRSDQIFLEAMEVLGVSKWKRNTMYVAVRMFSWLFWNRKRKPLIPACVLCLSLLSGCAYFGTNFVIGSGSQEKEYYESGKLKQERKECKSPISDVVNIQGVKN